MNKTLATTFKTTLLAAALFGAASVQAGTINMTGWLSGTSPESVTVASPAPITGNPVNAGAFEGTYTNGTTIGPMPFWCYELTQTFNWGQIPSTYTPVDYTNAGFAAQEALLSQLFQAAGAGATGSSDGATAFQLAVWEIKYETNTLSPRSLSNGNFTGSVNSPAGSNAINLANTWLANLGSFSDRHDVVWYQSSLNQDFIGRPPGRQVPEPGSLALIGAALAAAFLPKRRRKTGA